MSNASNRRRWWLGRSGATALEYALVLPAFVLLMFGTIELGRYFFTAQLVQTIAAEAARVAVIDYSKSDRTAGTDCANLSSLSTAQIAFFETIKSTINAKTPFLNINNLGICINYSLASGVVTLRVRVEYPFSTVVPMAALTFLSGRTISESATMVYSQFSGDRS